MDKQEIQIREWEQRYESYRSMRGQYMQSVGIAFTIWILALAFALRAGMSARDKPYCLGFSTILMLIYFAVHLFTRKEVRKLGDRIEELEGCLGMQEYRTTRTFEGALLYTIAAISSASLLSGFLTIRSIVGG